MQDRTGLIAKFSLGSPSLDPNKYTITAAGPPVVCTRACSFPLIMQPVQKSECPPCGNFSHPFWHHKASWKVRQKEQQWQFGDQTQTSLMRDFRARGTQTARLGQQLLPPPQPGQGTGAICSSTKPRQHHSPDSPRPTETVSTKFSHFLLSLFSQFQLWLLYLLFLFLKTHLEMKPFITAYPQTVCGSVIDNESAAKMKMLF